MTEIFIPPATVNKLNSEYPKGTRHKAKIDMALPLIGSGLSFAAVYQTLIEKFPEATQGEIEGVIKWCQGRNPQPCTSTNGSYKNREYKPSQRAEQKPKLSPSDHCKWWMGEAKTTPEQITQRSPVTLPHTPDGDLILFLETLYGPEEQINVVCNYTTNEDGKANPSGAGKNITRDDWVSWIKIKGVPESNAGAWVRMNPCRDGSGYEGAVTEADVTAWRFVLLESDAVEIETQIAMFERFKLPLSAITMSGGKSVHAWLRVDCKDADRYKEVATEILSILEPFGIDKANKNASRLSRLPSAQRKIKATGDGVQRLLYLNPKANPVENFESLKLRVGVPIIKDAPMRSLILDSIGRYEELFLNRGRLGVQVGLHSFDRDTGGFKPGQMTTIAAGTNQGKSTVAINLINGALKRGHGVALFTLEMDSEEIVDLLVTNNCLVNRNCFNTGDFQVGDQEKIAAQINTLAALPLWIYDDATITVPEIAHRVKLLKEEGRIELVVIDYVQIVAPDNQNLPREQQVAEIARGIRTLAKQTKLPFIVLSQLNDEGKLRESRVVAHESHNVIILEPSEDQTQMVMKVVKGRRIMKKDYELRYQPQYARVFENVVDPSDVEERNPHND